MQRREKDGKFGGSDDRRSEAGQILTAADVRPGDILQGYGTVDTVYRTSDQTIIVANGHGHEVQADGPVHVKPAERHSLSECGVTLSCEMHNGPYHHRVTLTNADGHSAVFDHYGPRPTPAKVTDNLAAQARDFDASSGFDDYCQRWGVYGARAEREYNADRAVNDKLRSILGTHYSTIVYGGQRDRNI